MKAKKSLGQHFLKSERVLAKIVETAGLKPGKTAIEIGPGTGILTERLLQTGARVIAVEKDDQLYDFLNSKFENKNLKLIHGDILDLKIENLKSDNYTLVANIPYNITGAILKKFLSAAHQPTCAVLLVQKEVAERIVAKKSKPFDSAQGKESILSISVKVYGEPKYIETVKAGSFVPMPKVDSATISIANISKRSFRDFSEEFFFKLLHAGFKSKRKKLSSNLATVFDKEKIARVFEKLNLDENIRAENVPITSWKEMATALSVV